MNEQPTTVYEAVGGEPTFQRLVDEFYDLVAMNTILRPLFPESFIEVKERQYWFLTQLFGGPRLYFENRGQPMLRMRHLQFPVTAAHAREWLDCMQRAMQKASITGPAREAMMQRLTMTAYHMVNTDGSDE